MKTKEEVEQRIELLKSEIAKLHGYLDATYDDDQRVLRLHRNIKEMQANIQFLQWVLEP